MKRHLFPLSQSFLINQSINQRPLSVPISPPHPTALDSPCRQSRLDLFPLLLPHFPHLLLRAVEPRIHLIKRILGTPFKLLPNHVLPLLLPQALVLLFQFRHAPSLLRRVGGLESSLGMSVDLVRRVGGREG